MHSIMIIRIQSLLVHYTIHLHLHKRYGFQYNHFVHFITPPGWNTQQNSSKTIIKNIFTTLHSVLVTPSTYLVFLMLSFHLCLSQAFSFCPTRHFAEQGFHLTTFKTFYLILSHLVPTNWSSFPLFRNK